MQLRRPLQGIALIAGLCASWSGARAADFALDNDTIESLLRYFSDSEHVSVRSVMGDYSFPVAKDAALAVHWMNERVVIPGVSAAPGSVGVSLTIQQL